MELENIKKGMKVFIRKECFNTRVTQGWQPEMNQYKGSIQKVGSIKSNVPNPYVKINSWCWDVRDLIPPAVIEETEKKVEKIIFLDESKLWL